MRLLYFAWVRQKLGTAEESMSLPADVTTVKELIACLEKRGGSYADVFGYPERLRAAVNQEHVHFGARLCDADEVAFFPPVTGG